MFKRSDFLKYLAITFLKNIEEILKKLKNTRRFDVNGRHYQYNMNVLQIQEKQQFIKRKVRYKNMSQVKQRV